MRYHTKVSSKLNNKEKMSKKEEAENIMEIVFEGKFDHKCQI